MKKLRFILTLRLFAVYDVLFARKFKLETFKNGKMNNLTQLDTDEVKKSNL